jgi:hypothetical protein
MYSALCGAPPARFDSFRLLSLLKIRPSACMEKEFSTLSSAIRRMISQQEKGLAFGP